MKEHNIEKIISDGDLKDFIIGNGPYTTHRPEEDTAKWSALEKYYFDQKLQFFEKMTFFRPSACRLHRGQSNFFFQKIPRGSKNLKNLKKCLF